MSESDKQFDEALNKARDKSTKRVPTQLELEQAATIEALRDRIKDMLEGDDGQAWDEAEKALELLAKQPCQHLADYRDEVIEPYKRKAELWDAFCSNARIRILGSAKLGQLGYQHIGFELWTMYGTEGESYDFSEGNAEAIRQLEVYLDAWMQTLKQKPNGGRG